MKMEIQCTKICPYEDYMIVYVENHRGEKKQKFLLAVVSERPCDAR